MPAHNKTYFTKVMDKFRIDLEDIRPIRLAKGLEWD